MPAKPNRDRRRIGLLGGSFNPPHAGHREISLAALDRLKLDQVWWLVTPGNPLKDANSYAPFEERMRMAQEISNHRDIAVSDFEHRHNLQYTVDTLNRLTQEHSEFQFIWLMGADSLENFHLWKDWEEVAKRVPIAVFNRPAHEERALNSQAAIALSTARIDAGDPEQLTQSPLPAWVFFSDTENLVSSTDIRNRAHKSKAPKYMTDLTAPHGPLAFFLDLHPDLGDFEADLIAGLSLSQKSISPKYFYDAHGSKLFNHITEAEEYYPTRIEKEIFLTNAKAITASVGPGTAIFEYGSGSSEKIEWLIKGLANPTAYVALDISKTHLIESASSLARDHALPIAAVCADFQAPIKLPTGILPQEERWLGFFPGSTIGNMAPDGAIAFLENASKTLGAGAKFLLGVDLEKDPAILTAAYNDKEGVTAAFNLNILRRMQLELDAGLNLDDFAHHAFYNEDQCRIEMHLRAIKPTSIMVKGRKFTFAEGETLHTENSHKYSITRLKALIEQTPWRLDDVWTDPKGWFAACLLSNK